MLKNAHAAVTITANTEEYTIKSNEWVQYHLAKNIYKC